MTTLLTLSLSTVKPTSPLLLFTQHPSLNPLQRKISVRRHLSQAPPFGSFSSWYYVSHSINLTIVLTIFAGLMSGLTVGYLSVDDLTMELRMTSGTEEEKHYASQVLPILSNRHWLLVTLLLMNSFAMALPVFLDRIVHRIWAVVISVTLILIFGEVIPMAVCTGPNQVKIAAFVAPVVRLLMLVSWPLSYWIGKLLDIILGEHHKSRYLNSDLKALVELHTYQALKKLQEEEEQHRFIAKDEIAKPSDKMGLNDLEATLMISALEIREKKVIEIMIPFKKVFLLNFEEKIDKNKLSVILEKGYSRIPVFTNKNENDIIGLLRIKQLLTVDIIQSRSLREIGVHLKPPLVIHPNMNLVDLLREFRQGKSHMALITEQVEKLQSKLGLNRTNSLAVENKYLYPSKGDLGIIILGIVTLEDVIENIFNLEIVGEEEYEKIRKEKLAMPPGKRSNSKINMYFTRDVAQNFINDESQKIDELIKEGLKKKSLKENFMNKMDVEMTSDPPHNLKDPLL